MSAPTNFIAYYTSSPEVLYEYNWQQTFGSMFREIFVHFPFDFSWAFELTITEEMAYNLPLFTFWDFSLWDKMLWCINFFITFAVIFAVIFGIFLAIKKILQYVHGLIRRVQDRV